MNEYEKYKLEWMIAHGHTIPQLVRELQLMLEESDGDESLEELYKEWEFSFGFGSEIWACEAEWESSGKM